MWWAQGAPGADVDDYIDDLVAQGWDDESIAEERAEAEQLAEPRYIRPENWPTVLVFCRCTWTKVIGFTHVEWIGISAQEVLAAAQLLRIPRKDWPEVQAGIALMVDAALPLLNAAKE